MSDGGKEDKFPAYRAAGVVFFTAVKGKVADRSPKRKPTSEIFSHSHAFPKKYGFDFSRCHHIAFSFAAERIMALHSS